jgi:hypothetical protein
MVFHLFKCNKYTPFLQLQIEGFLYRILHQTHTCLHKVHLKPNCTQIYTLLYLYCSTCSNLIIGITFCIVMHQYLGRFVFDLNSHTLHTVITTLHYFPQFQYLPPLIYDAAVCRYLV